MNASMPLDSSAVVTARLIENYRRRTFRDVWKPLTSGAVAGAVAKTAIAPLDRAKIHFQVSSKQFTVPNLRKFLMANMRERGFFSLWRGNSATMARIIPYASIQFAAHEYWKMSFIFYWGYPLPHVAQFCAGSLAGMTAVSMTYPFDMLRARMAVVSKDRYPNLVETIFRIYRQEGAAAFYHGFTPTILGIIPYAGVSFFTYEKLKQYHRRDGSELSTHNRLVYGAIAGVLGQTSSYPLDVVRRRMQTAGALVLDSSKASGYRHIFRTMKFIWKEGGLVRGVYKGLSMNWIKGPIASGLSFTTFDLMMAFLHMFLPVIVKMILVGYRRGRVMRFPLS